MNAIRRESTKTLFQKRTYIGWAGLSVVPFLIAIAFRFSTGHPHGGRPGPSPELTTGLFFELARSSGLYVVMISLITMSSFLLPMLAAMMGSYTVAGEAENGTLRTSLMQPIRRGTLLMSKWSAANLYMAIGLLLMGLAALVAGGAFFGLKPVLLLSGHTTGVWHALGLLAAGYAYIFVGMMAVVSLAVLFSTLTDSSLTAAAAALVSVIIMMVLQALPFFDFLQPYLFTSHFESWSSLLHSPIAWGPLTDGLIAFAGWISVTTGLAYLHFRRKDILS